MYIKDSIDLDRLCKALGFTKGREYWNKDGVYIHMQNRGVYIQTAKDPYGYKAPVPNVIAKLVLNGAIDLDKGVC